MTTSWPCATASRASCAPMWPAPMSPIVAMIISLSRGPAGSGWLRSSLEELRIRNRIRLGADVPHLPAIAGAIVKGLGASPISPSVRDALAGIHQQALELIVRGASLDAVLEALCDGIDALDPDLIASVLLADRDGQRLWPKAGRRVPEDWKRFITPLPIGPCVGACGTAAFRKERVINQDIATDPLWSGAAEKYRTIALQHGLRTAWSVPILSKHGELLGTFGLHHARSKS